MAGTKDSGVGTTPQFLTAIDFGTTHCSVAYLLRPDETSSRNKVDPIVLKLDNAGRKRVPSCILFDNNGNKIAFGYEAREQFTSLNRKPISKTVKFFPEYHYFEHVKGHLQREKNINRDQKISTMNGKEFFLVDVIAHILHHLKCQLLTLLRDFGYKELKASDIDWVITVPAIWKPRGRKMMYEAGYMAGLCSDAEPPPIRIATGHHSPPQKGKSPEKLSLALEPESAAVHCQYTAKEYGKGSEHFTVIDIGGGTVDIASHVIREDRIGEVAATLAGNFCGGITVNERFSEFLQGFVDDRKFSHYIEKCTPEEETQHKADLSAFLYGKSGFESEKMRFGSSDGSGPCYFQFPQSFWKVYKDSLLKKMGDMSVQVKDGMMQIDASKMAEFFQPAIDGITDLIEAHLQKSKDTRTFEMVYWVGGFGGCKYLHTQLEEKIKEYFQGCKYHFTVPLEPELAVIRGAAAFCCDPSIVMKGLPSHKQAAADKQAPNMEPLQKDAAGKILLVSGTKMDCRAKFGTVPTPKKSEQDNTPQTPTSTDTLDDEKHLLDISNYLDGLQKKEIYQLGLVLGLRHTKLKDKMDTSPVFLEDVIAAWLREEDYVKERGEPSWTVLIRALENRRVGQNGIASQIEKDKGFKGIPMIDIFGR